MKTALLWCFPHEMRAALAFRERYAGRVMIRNVRVLKPESDYEEADEIYSGVYSYGRVAKMYEGTPHTVEEVWLEPEYRHRVDEVNGGYRLMERESKQWRPKGDVQPTEEGAWAILDEKELGL
jgi:hypothetical protein